MDELNTKNRLLSELIKMFEDNKIHSFEDLEKVKIVLSKKYSTELISNKFIPQKYLNSLKNKPNIEKAIKITGRKSSIYEDFEINQILADLKEKEKISKPEYQVEIKIVKIYESWMVVSYTGEIKYFKEEENVTISKKTLKIHLIDKVNKQITLYKSNQNYAVGQILTLTKSEPPNLIKSQIKSLEMLINKDPTCTNLINLIFNNHFIAPKNQETNRIDFTNKKLNDEQKEFIQKTINLILDDNAYYYLCWGPPGTGKTTCIQEIVKWAILNKKRILVSSFTNVAVDNIINKLIEDHKKDIIRLGSDASIRLENVLQVSESKKIQCGKNRRDEIKKHLIVGSTLDKIGIEEIDYTFDLAILDESSMIEFPKALLAIIKAKKFIMVGDPEQLEPIQIKNKNEDTYYPCEMLAFFNRLIKVKQPNYTQLVYQYRSQESTIGFSAKYFYNNNLKTIKPILDQNEILAQIPNNPLINEVISNENGIIWINTNGLKYNNPLYWRNKVCLYCGNKNLVNVWDKYLYAWKYNARCGSCLKDVENYYCNPAETYLTVYLVSYLSYLLRLKGYTDNQIFEKIAIISNFNHQISATKKVLLSNKLFSTALGDKENKLSVLEKLEKIKNLEFGTIHRFQGREKEYIILPLVYNEKQDQAYFDSHGLLNVALTRAKIKTIIIGDFSKIKRYSFKDDFNPDSMKFNEKTNKLQYLYQYLLEKKNKEKNKVWIKTLTQDNLKNIYGSKLLDYESICGEILSFFDLKYANSMSQPFTYDKQSLIELKSILEKIESELNNLSSLKYELKKYTNIKNLKEKELKLEQLKNSLINKIKNKEHEINEINYKISILSKEIINLIFQDTSILNQSNYYDLIKNLIANVNEYGLDSKKIKETILSIQKKFLTDDFIDENILDRIRIEADKIMSMRHSMKHSNKKYVAPTWEDIKTKVLPKNMIIKKEKLIQYEKSYYFQIREIPEGNYVLGTRKAGDLD